ncbi:unnamed protein product [Cyprideis torosa]|uniref:Uncharacterized protein n=1 Tax=Cyprideis torosa TaxID=163714 RepID=A0A7R8WPJ2_9CRUS|nr:unnamed protein product [Cyprideis torosa]CAG0901606.1 unnamed protein product [Cyprideis torosa]
MTMSTACVT